MWFEETGTVRINQERADQLLSTGAPVIGTACPFCEVMLRDGVEARRGDREVRLLDVAELLEQATRPRSASPQTGRDEAGTSASEVGEARIQR